MKKNLFRIVGVAAAVTLFAGTAFAADNELTIYSARSENLNNAVIENFEKDTGIHVDVVIAGTGEAIKRVDSEKNNPLGDILWAGSEAMLAARDDLFMPYVSPENDNMMPQFRNRTGFITPAFSDPTVFIVNKDYLEDLGVEVKGFKDLLNPELKGCISFGDPVNSSSAFQCLVCMLYDMGNGDPMSKPAWDYVDKFLAQLEGKMANSSSQVYRSVAGGEYAVGLTWEDPAAALVKVGAPVAVVFPEEGALYAPQSVQIIKNCKHPEAAKKFVDYMISAEAQNLVGSTLTVRPLRSGAELADYMIPASNIVEAPEYDEAWVAEHKKEITEEFTRHMEETM